MYTKVKLLLEKILTYQTKLRLKINSLAEEEERKKEKEEEALKKAELELKK